MLTVSAHSFFLYISDGSKKTVGDGFTEGSLRVRNATKTVSTSISSQTNSSVL